MRKANLNFLVDAAAFLGFVLLAATGVLVRYVLPPGSGHFRTVWAMDRHEWGQVHFWIAVALLLFLAVHLFLHWRWVVALVKGRVSEASGKRLGIAIVAIVALVALALAPFFAPVEQGGESPHKMRDPESEETAFDEIDGSMTLEEVEKATGVSAAIILEALGLPPETPTDTRLGRLRKEHDFDVHDVRNILRKQVGKP